MTQRNTTPRAVSVQIGRQTPFPAEIVGNTVEGPVIREADGTETIIPIEDINDGEITIIPERKPQRIQPDPKSKSRAKNILGELIYSSWFIFMLIAVGIWGAFTGNPYTWFCFALALWLVVSIFWNEWKG